MYHSKISNLKRAYNINGSNILRNCSFTEVKMALRKRPEMASPALLFFKNFWGRTPNPPSRLENMCFIFQSNTAQPKL